MMDYDLPPVLVTALALLALALAALFANFVVKAILVRVLNKVLGYTVWGRDPELRRHGVIERLANIMPALVVSNGIMLVPNLPAFAVVVVKNVASAFMILTVAMAISAAFNVIDTIYHRRPEARLKPIKGYVQVVKIAIYVIAALLMIATLVDRSPLILLSGLGAMAAVLILVFQDTLLSLVAGIQISSTDMVRVGDWIEMPGQNADGDVIEIALHTVKVQNFDKTVTTVPIRKLVTEPFKNWRAMQESGGRRIKRAIYLDQESIHFLGSTDLDRLAAVGHLETYLLKKREELAEWNAKLGERAKVPANTRRSTNIGTFRAYVENYLRSHPGVRSDMTLLVRQLPPAPEGLPLEIYCFTNTVVWAQYEGIQSDIFDHLLAILPEFGLRVFQNPSGRDVREMVRSPEREAELSIA
ncbi:mechanosensitive ion channel family protein [Aquamicrobium zhengzhouense]|uniref:Mechanosensitive ion channel family protein n=1 Tax=Aquamicrobium zhengzhouense TaxID=2781738 RepID=A0ABS0SGK7_9HYPH|nr:mechanosensitive ion channel family protein [Aquamicrobium zhengzhouense]MBI1622366.1 mechanosensitive ion channel family protein [Aquamicrobium zhengzhouense]